MKQEIAPTTAPMVPMMIPICGSTVIWIISFDSSSESAEQNVEIQTEQTVVSEEVVQVQEQIQTERKALMDSMSAEMTENAPANNEENSKVAFSFETKAE